jgi:hypothetical protein
MYSFYDFRQDNFPGFSLPTPNSDVAKQMFDKIKPMLDNKTPIQYWVSVLREVDDDNSLGNIIAMSAGKFEISCGNYIATVDFLCNLTPDFRPGLGQKIFEENIKTFIEVWQDPIVKISPVSEKSYHCYTKVAKKLGYDIKCVGSDKVYSVDKFSDVTGYLILIPKSRNY